MKNLSKTSILAKAFSRLSARFMDFSLLKDFNFSYLSGFLSEKYDMTSDEVIEEAINRAKLLTDEENPSSQIYKLLSLILSKS